MNMRYRYVLLISCFLILVNSLKAQTGPWAKYDNKMKGEALIRESDAGYLKEVQSIVAGGGDVNWQMQPSGLTALMAAASAGHIEVVKFLIKSGANANLKDANGRTALDRAKQKGATDIVTLLNPVTNSPAPVIPPKKQQLPPIPKPVDTNTTKITPPVVKPVKNNLLKNSWAPFGTYTVGTKVLFFNGSWHTGTVIEIGTAGDYTRKNAVPGERKYLIAREGAPNWNEWTDWGRVTGLTRENFWTDYFLGEWKLGETMAVNTRTDGSYQRDEYSFHGAAEALQVNINHTFKWKTIDRKTITGTWKPAVDGAGIILLKAYQGQDWTLRNETNSVEENIRRLQGARLTATGKMSITAKRPL